MNTYQLLDSGHGKKWERFGPYTLLRPCSQAVWSPQRKEEWAGADATFEREDAKRWTLRTKLPPSWTIELCGVRLKVSLTDFGHVGLFPEHASLWQEVRPHLCKPCRLLNLFAYSGGATLAAAQEGAEVCHLDASKGMVDWARENSALNGLQKAPIRWIVDDALKFLKREKRRASLYDAILLDPPTFGRGTQGEVFKIEEEIVPLLTLCRELLTERPRLLLFSCHTPGFTPTTLTHLLHQVFPRGDIRAKELLLQSSGALPIPSGAYAIWTP